MLSRIATFGNLSAMVASSLKVQAKLADQESQEASNLKSPTLSGLGEPTAAFLRLSQQSARLSADKDAATSAGDVVQAAYSATSTLADLAATVRSKIAATQSNESSGAAAEITSDDASSWLNTLQSALNTNLGGLYVFGGQASGSPPVDFSNPSYDPSASPNTADTAYYQGSTTARTLTTSEGSTLQISTTADSAPFEQFARILSLMKANPGDPAALSSAYDQLGDIADQLGATEQRLSGQAEALDNVATSNDAKITTLNNLASTIDGADLSTTAVLVTQYQTQLEALYSTISKLSSESILKYLS